MLDKLEDIMIELPSLITNSSLWKSLIVNKRKPHTYRASTLVGDTRVCLHRFEVCAENEAFAHPHPWPGAFKVLGGEYRQKIWRAPGTHTVPIWATEDEPPLIDMTLTPGSVYEISNPLTWHNVQPVKGHFPGEANTLFNRWPPSAWSVMVNGTPWDADTVHRSAPTTAGKDLDRMTPLALQDHLDAFRVLLKMGERL